MRRGAGCAFFGLSGEELLVCDGLTVAEDEAFEAEEPLEDEEGGACAGEDDASAAFGLKKPRSVRWPGSAVDFVALAITDSESERIRVAVGGDAAVEDASTSAKARGVSTRHHHHHHPASSPVMPLVRLEVSNFK